MFLVRPHVSTTTKSVGPYEALRLEVVRLASPLSVALAAYRAIFYLVYERTPCTVVTEHRHVVIKFALRKRVCWSVGAEALS
jgi:hypothetical protein